MKLMRMICPSNYYTQQTSYLAFTYLGGPKIVSEGRKEGRKQGRQDRSE
jgi:hypothetical protein